MLPHEQKMSVLNFVVKKLPGCNDIIQSKERLIFHCGYRRFAACPIFSQVGPELLTASNFNLQGLLVDEAGPTYEQICLFALHLY